MMYWHLKKSKSKLYVIYLLKELFGSVAGITGVAQHMLCRFINTLGQQLQTNNLMFSFLYSSYVDSRNPKFVANFLKCQYIIPPITRK